MRSRQHTLKHQTSWLQRTLEKVWYQGGKGAFLLRPLEAVYRFLAIINKRVSLSKQVNHQVPVVVVGNISVGGTGKTPLVIYLADLLQEAGYKPGIITRGYGGLSQQWPANVEAHSDTVLYGDEPVLMAQRSGVPVVAGPDRNDDIDTLLKQHDVNIVISDDGLQHYKLKRDIEIVVIDGARGLGNQYCLPAGPLREPLSRLSRCDFVVVNEAKPAATISMQLVCDRGCHLKTNHQQPLSEWRGKHIHAVTGIGNPDRFFDMLEDLGFHCIKHAFPDHHAFSFADIDFGDDFPVIMTEKDAVKCRAFADDHHWFIPVSATVSKVFANDLLAQIRNIECENK